MGTSVYITTRPVTPDKRVRWALWHCLFRFGACLFESGMATGPGVNRSPSNVEMIGRETRRSRPPLRVSRAHAGCMNRCMGRLPVDGGGRVLQTNRPSKGVISACREGAVGLPYRSTNQTPRILTTRGTHGSGPPVAGRRPTPPTPTEASQGWEELPGRSDPSRPPWDCACSRAPSGPTTRPSRPISGRLPPPRLLRPARRPPGRRVRPRPCRARRPPR